MNKYEEMLRSGKMIKLGKSQENYVVVRRWEGYKKPCLGVFDGRNLHKIAIFGGYEELEILFNCLLKMKAITEIKEGEEDNVK